MKITRVRFFIILIFMLGVTTACQVSASKPPTAFTFPTPDLTGTALYSFVATSLAPSPSPFDSSTPPATEPTLPSATSIPAYTATSAPIVSPYPTLTPLPTITPFLTVTQLPTNTSAPLYRTVGKIAASFFQTPPNIDGNLSKWGLYQYSANYVVYGKEDWVDTQDLSATVMVGWDYTNLYFGVRVFDSRYVQNAVGEYLYKGDSLEILLDTNLAADFYVDKLSPDDFQLGISPGSPDLGDSPQAYLWFPRTITGLRTQVRIASQEVDGGYHVEVAVPWSVFEVIPVAGQHFGFAFSVSDNDKRTENLQQSMVSSVPNRRLINPTTWGDLFLGMP